MPLPTVKVNITGLADADPSTKQRPSGTFSPGNGNPNWAQTNTSGDIDVTGAPNQGGQEGAKVTIEFTLDLGNLSTLQFAAANSTTPAPISGGPDDGGDFTIVSVSADGKTLTVTDNNDESRFTQFEYTLGFNDETILDPRVINR